MPRESTTQLRELSMQISRLLDQFANSGDTFTPILNSLNGVLVAVDAMIEARQAAGPPA